MRSEAVWQEGADEVTARSWLLSMSSEATLSKCSCSHLVRLARTPGADVAHRLGANDSADDTIVSENARWDICRLQNNIILGLVSNTGHGTCRRLNIAIQFRYPVARQERQTRPSERGIYLDHTSRHLGQQSAMDT
jgi:hypothetical protein